MNPIKGIKEYSGRVREEFTAMQHEIYMRYSGILSIYTATYHGIGPPEYDLYGELSPGMTREQYEKQKKISMIKWRAPSYGMAAIASPVAFLKAFRTKP